jgi:hypothetical protein
LFSAALEQIPAADEKTLKMILVDSFDLYQVASAKFFEQTRRMIQRVPAPGAPRARAPEPGFEATRYLRAEAAGSTESATASV